MTPRRSRFIFVSGLVVLTACTHTRTVYVDKATTTTARPVVTWSPTTIPPTTVYVPPPTPPLPPATTRVTAPPLTFVNRPAPTTEPARTSSSDKGFALVHLEIRRAGDGTFGGVARIENRNSTSKTAVWTVSLFRGNDLVGHLQGSGSNIGSGQTVTEDLYSSDPHVPGVTRFEFQTDVAY